MKIWPKTLWVFYYKTSRNGEWFVIGTQECKQPQRTKMRKELKKYWQRPDVVGTGYTNDVNDPDLVWPQSKIS
jgi:hypothetical protein